MRYNYRTKPQQNAVRIDTCIVGDDTTCDIAQNEVCKTDLGVSSCHCRPGNSRFQRFQLFFVCFFKNGTFVYTKHQINQTYYNLDLDILLWEIFLKLEFEYFIFFYKGYSRRKYRDPCRRVVSLIMSMRIDKYYEKPIVWDKVYADPNSEQFEHMSFEALRAVSFECICLIHIFYCSLRDILCQVFFSF